MSEILAKNQVESVNLLKAEIGSDLTILVIIDYLKDRSQFSLNGRAGTHTMVNKEALRLAAVYLEDYMMVIEGDSI